MPEKNPDRKSLKQRIGNRLSKVNWEVLVGFAGLCLTFYFSQQQLNQTLQISTDERAANQQIFREQRQIDSARYQKQRKTDSTRFAEQRHVDSIRFFEQRYFDSLIYANQIEENKRQFNLNYAHTAKQLSQMDSQMLLTRQQLNLTLQEISGEADKIKDREKLENCLEVAMVEIRSVATGLKHFRGYKSLTHGFPYDRIEMYDLGRSEIDSIIAVNFERIYSWRFYAKDNVRLDSAGLVTVIEEYVDNIYFFVSYPQDYELLLEEFTPNKVASIYGDDREELVHILSYVKDIKSMLSQKRITELLVDEVSNNPRIQHYQFMIDLESRVNSKRIKRGDWTGATLKMVELAVAEYFSKLTRLYRHIDIYTRHPPSRQTTD